MKEEMSLPSLSMLVMLRTPEFQFAWRMNNPTNFFNNVYLSDNTKKFEIVMVNSFNKLGESIKKSIDLNLLTLDQIGELQGLVIKNDGYFKSIRDFTHSERKKYSELYGADHYVINYELSTDALLNPKNYLNGIFQIPDELFKEIMLHLEEIDPQDILDLIINLGINHSEKLQIIANQFFKKDRELDEEDLDDPSLASCIPDKIDTLRFIWTHLKQDKLETVWITVKYAFYYSVSLGKELWVSLNDESKQALSYEFQEDKYSQEGLISSLQNLTDLCTWIQQQPNNPNLSDVMIGCSFLEKVNQCDPLSIQFWIGMTNAQKQETICIVKNEFNQAKLIMAKTEKPIHTTTDVMDPRNILCKHAKALLSLGLQEPEYEKVIDVCKFYLDCHDMYHFNKENFQEALQTFKAQYCKTIAFFIPPQILKDLKDPSVFKKLSLRFDYLDTFVGEIDWFQTDLSKIKLRVLSVEEWTSLFKLHIEMMDDYLKTSGEKARPDEISKIWNEILDVVFKFQCDQTIQDIIQDIKHKTTRTEVGNECGKCNIFGPLGQR